MKTRGAFWRRGFTLLELLVVIVILGLIMAIATPQLMKLLGGAKQDAAKLQMQALGQSLDLYKLDVGSYPTDEQGLNVLLAAPEGAVGWAGPYAKSHDQLVDPWGVPYHYELSARGYTIATWGEDRSEGGEGEASDLAWP